MSDCASVSIHMSAKPSQLTDTEFNAKKMSYSRLIGKLLYVLNCTRPNIIASVNHLSRCMAHHDVEQCIQAK